MKYLPLFLPLVVLIHARSPGSDHPSDVHCTSEDVWDLDGICYVFGARPMNFQAARLHCVSHFLAGDLATLLEGKQAQNMRQYLSEQLPSLLNRYYKPQSKLELQESKAENSPAAVEEVQIHHQESLQFLDALRDVVTEEHEGVHSTTGSTDLDPESLELEDDAIPCVENQTHVQSKGETDESGQAGGVNGTKIRCKPKSAILKEKVAKNDSRHDKVSAAKDGVPAEVLLEKELARTARQPRQLPSKHQAGLWVGAYRGDSTLEKILELTSGKDAVFMWLRLSSTFLLHGNLGEDCVYADPEDNFKLRASNCSEHRVPLCQLHACPPRRCFNGGLCKNGTCLCLDGDQGSQCEIRRSEMPQKMAIAQDPVMVANRLETSSRMDPGLRNLLIALFITVVGSLVIALIFSKERIRRMVRGRGNEALQDEEEELETVESVPMGMGAINITRRASRASSSPKRSTADNSTANASSAAKEDSTTEVATPAASADCLSSSCIDAVAEATLIDIKDIHIATTAAAAVDETCAAEVVVVDAETRCPVDGASSSKGDT